MKRITLLLLCPVFVACASAVAPLPSDGCGGVAHTVVTYDNAAEIHALLQLQRDSDRPGIANLDAFSDSTCQAAPATSNSMSLVLVTTSSAPDSLFAYGAGSYLKDAEYLSGPTVVAAGVRSGDSTVYTVTATAPTGTEAEIIGIGFRFPVISQSPDDNVNYAAGWIRRVTVQFNYERP